MNTKVSNYIFVLLLILIQISFYSSVKINKIQSNKSNSVKELSNQINLQENKISAQSFVELNKKKKAKKPKKKSNKSN